MVPRTGSFVAVVLLGWGFACGHPSQSAATAAPPAGERAPRRTPAALDDARMFDDLLHLSADDLGGRFSLSDDLARAATYLAAQLEAAGVRPVGDDYSHPFPYSTGVARGAATSVTVTGPRGAHTADAARLLPRPEGRVGTAEGPVVFVGYGISPAAPAAGATHDDPDYDDLAGVDLQGKIALFLLYGPKTPDPTALFKQLEAVAARFEEKAAPARAAGDRAALTALHRAARKEIADLLAPFVGKDALPDDFTAPPEDPTATLDMMVILGPVFRAWQDRPGPKISPRDLALSRKLARIAEKKAAGAIVVAGPSSYLAPEDRKAATLPDLSQIRPSETPAPLPVVQMAWDEADRRFVLRGKRLSRWQARIDRTMEPSSFPTKLSAKIASDYAPVTRPLHNVLAYVPGTERPEEIVVVGAHYDHIGTTEKGMCRPAKGDGGREDRICNGADDNASGTAMVLELARSFARAKPRRSVVFAFFAGEELGLFGSKALADDPPRAPPFDGGRVVAMINLDMVGRLGPKGLAIGGVGSSSAWMPLLDEIGNEGLKILYERAVASRSDQANFYRHEIPVLFFFTGIHRDYHRAGDEADAINRPGMARIGRLVARTVWAVADGLDVPFTPPRTEAEGLVGGLPGSNPATVEKKVRPDGSTY